MSKSAEKLCILSTQWQSPFSLFTGKKTFVQFKGKKKPLTSQCEHTYNHTLMHKQSSHNLTLQSFNQTTMTCANIGLNWLKSNTTNFEVTYPFFTLLLLGPMLRSLGQRDGEERERIFKRPPLPWRESRGATGVKTPDNQSGILKFHRLHQLVTKPQPSSLE